MDDPIDWTAIKEDRFNQVVESLLYSEHTDPSRQRRCRAINGRGGDGGIDVGIWDTENNRVVEIFQLKHYLDGWPARGKGRRPSITDSFDKAWSNHHPSRWTLVTPSNPTMNELQFVQDLGKGKGVQIDVMGPAELDALLAKHPDLHARFAVDRGRELLRDVGRAPFALNKPGDLADVMSLVQDQLKKRSDHWSPAFSMDEHGTFTQEIRAVTPDADEQEPLQLTFTANFSDETRDQRDAFQDAIRHGVTEPVTLDSSVLGTVRFLGPEWFQEEFDGGTLTLLPTDEDAGMSGLITARDVDGVRLGGLAAATKRIARGSESVRVVMDSPGGLETIWTLPRDVEQAGEIQFHTDFTGHRVRDVRKLTRFLSKSSSVGQLELELDGKTMAVAIHPGETFIENKAFSDFLDDLIFLEDELDIEFRIPGDDFTIDDRVWARIARRVIQGVAVPYPNVDGFTVTLSGERNVIEEFLDKEKVAFLVQNPEFIVTMLGVDVHLGHVFTVLSRGEFIDGPEHAAALRAGIGAGRKVQVKGTDGFPFVIYSPERLEGGKVVVTGWGIEGLPEHPKLAELRALQREQQVQLPGAEKQRKE